MSTHLIIVEKPIDWQRGFPDVEVISAKEYLSDSERFKTKGLRLINLCRNFNYLSTGYYCSLLAEARQHRVIPSINTVTNLSSKSIYSLDVWNLDEIVDKVLRKYSAQQETDAFSFYVFFGQSERAELQDIARQLFELFAAPLLRVEFRFARRWQIHSIKTVAINTLVDENAVFFADCLNRYLSSPWRNRKNRSQARYDIAILHNPEEKLPPSNSSALKKFIEAGKKIGADVELITRKDFNRLAEYDGLLIRETTAINHYTYRFARKAESEGLAVIDDPSSIIRCCNKVYLAELLAHNKVNTPRTTILRKGDKTDYFQRCEYPLVIKIPDGSFSRGVYKVEDAAKAEEVVRKLFKESDLLLAQEYLYTDYDWRVGILNHEVMYVCQYFMSPKHWQIVKHKDDGSSDLGRHLCVNPAAAPAHVVKAAQQAARLIGNGLYGVDVKEKDGKAYVIEVNDNPNLDAGVEDGILGAQLYIQLMSDLVRRIELRRKS